VIKRPGGHSNLCLARREERNAQEEGITCKSQCREGGSEWKRKANAKRHSNLFNGDVQGPFGQLRGKDKRRGAINMQRKSVEKEGVGRKGCTNSAPCIFSAGVEVA